MLPSLASLRTFLFLLQCSLSLSSPNHFFDEDDAPSNDTTSVDGLNTLLPRQGNGKPLLRIMPLGASITQGVKSNPENGYRKPLRDELRYLGFEVNMVGCQSTGSFNDRQHEGHPSKIISEITDLMGCGLKQKPNLVLINAGTNDVLQASQRASENHVSIAQWLSSGYDRMKTMVDMVFSESEGVTILLSTLIPNGNDVSNGYVNTINQRFRQLIVDYQSQGRHILLAEMNNGFITVGDLNVDGTHPTNEGYLKLAAVWTVGINNVISRNWIVPPINNTDSSGGGQCNPSPDNFRGPVQIQRGSGAEDGTYAHSSEPMGVKLDYLGLATSSLTKNFHFAQIVNRGGSDPPYQADELVRVLDEEQRHEGGLTQPAVSFRLNTGDGKFDNPWTEITLEQECLNRGVRWGDINGDGLDDFICINLEGKTWASINRGGNPPKFEYIGMIKDSLPWAPQDRIRLGDIDGDGRLDWCAIDDKGDIYCWRNSGVGDAPTEKYGGYWQSIEVGAPTFDAKGQPGIEGVRLIDINGDGRSDWVYVYEDGSTRIFINQRGTHKNTTIHGLKPAWIEASSAHRGFPGFPGVDRDHIKFGRIYSSGRADYIRIVDRDTRYQYDFEFYKNTGSGGTKLRGDGDHYCDMYGRGHDDYLWVWSTGMIELYENVDNPPLWNVHNQILDTGRDRKSIHFGDWDGDGLCDVLSVDKHTGNVDMWRNTYSGGPVPTFEYKGQVVGGSRCTQGWGLGLYDLGLRFADIDGDKRVDYLCMEPNTTTTGYLNKASGLQDVHQIKLSTGFDRANHRWADVNGDGRADLMWVDKFSGNVTVWLNDGMKPSAGSSFNWPRANGVWMPGVDSGPNMHFAKISKSGRADFVQVTPKDNLAWVYYNECGEVQNGPGPDDGPISDPNLPTAPGSTNPVPGGPKPIREVFAMMGDSYGSGVGAGKQWEQQETADPCKRGDNGLGALLWADNRWWEDNTQQIQYIACSGSRANGMYQDGARWKDMDPQDKAFAGPENDAAVLWVGGNDAGFFKILDGCVYHFYGPFSTGCPEAIRDFLLRIQQGEFFDRFRRVYSEIMLAAHPKNDIFTLYVLAYPWFFDVTTGDCDNSVFCFWSWYCGEPLGQELRSDLNALVDELNSVLRRVAMEVAGAFSGTNKRIAMVNTNGVFEGHRFCEPGSVEPNPSNPRNWFFQLYDQDVAPDGTQYDNLAGWPNVTSATGEASLPAASSCDTTVSNDTLLDFGEQAACGISITLASNDSLTLADSRYPGAQSSDYGQVAYGRIFHPKARGYAAVKDLIIEVLDSDSHPAVTIF